MSSNRNNPAHFDENDSGYVWTEFYDVNGGLRDPADVFVVLTHVATDGTQTAETFEYGVDSEVVRVSTGYYRLNTGTLAVGKYYYRWYTTDVQAPSSREALFYVHAIEGQ